MVIQTLEELKTWVQSFAKQLQSPCVVLLNGEMGAGKTQLTHFLAEALRAKEATSSPTFAIHQRYHTPSVPLDHVDLYRIESEEELEGTGFWDLFNEPSILVVEWAERVEVTSWPLHWGLWLIEIVRNDDESRRLTVRHVR